MSRVWSLAQCLICVIYFLSVFNPVSSSRAYYRANQGDCSEGQFQCDAKYVRQCLSYNDVCDKFRDCQDYKDEMFCDCLSQDKIPCEMGSKCVTEAEICEGTETCPEYKDKIDCDHLTDETPINNHKVSNMDGNAQEIGRDDVESKEPRDMIEGGEKDLDKNSTVNDETEANITEPTANITAVNDHDLGPTENEDSEIVHAESEGSEIGQENEVTQMENIENEETKMEHKVAEDTELGHTEEVDMKGHTENNDTEINNLGMEGHVSVYTEKEEISVTPSSMENHDEQRVTDEEPIGQQDLEEYEATASTTEDPKMLHEFEDDHDLPTQTNKEAQN